jgi:kynureninase
LPKHAGKHIEHVTRVEWGERLIRSWNVSGWMDMPWRLGNKIGRLVGAKDGEVIAADSTSINIYKTMAAALALRPDRRIILSTPDNFPTDLYMIQGLMQQLGNRHALKLVDGESLAAHLNSDVAVMTLTHVNYRTGRMYDMAGLTAMAHAAGALTMWDLAHSAGAVHTDLNGANADMAVGCGYKYLNGGPGAPAYLFVAQRHQASFSQPLSGWLGHANPFAFTNNYEPAEGIGRYMCGTPPVLSMSALECGVDMFIEADMTRVRAKSLALTDYFMQLIDERCGGHGLRLATPRDHAIRGSQVSYHHAEGYAIMQALIARGVIGDFRAPDIVRFGFTPLYTTFADVWDAVDQIDAVLTDREWDKPEWKQRKKVT